VTCGRGGRAPREVPLAAPEHGEDSVAGDGVADGRERGEQDAGLRACGRCAEAAAATVRPRHRSKTRDDARGGAVSRLRERGETGMAGDLPHLAAWMGGRTHSRRGEGEEEELEW